MSFSRRRSPALSTSVPSSVASPQRALVVDDARSLREHTAELMRGRCALQVIEAENGVQALKKLQEHNFDVVLTDVEMPLLDGLKLTDLVRRGSSNPRVPILVMTSQTDPEAKGRALAVGASAFLSKPALDDEVVAQVQALLAGAAS